MNLQVNTNVVLSINYLIRCFYMYIHIVFILILSFNTFGAGTSAGAFDESTGSAEHIAGSGASNTAGSYPQPHISRAAIDVRKAEEAKNIEAVSATDPDRALKLAYLERLGTVSASTDSEDSDKE